MNCCFTSSWSWSQTETGSPYSYDKLCSLLRFTVDDYIEARDALIDLDLLAFDGTLFQVLSLPNERRKRPAVPETSHRTAWGWP